MLTTAQRERLEKAIASTDDIRIKRRMSIFILKDDGVITLGISNYLGIARRTVDYWLKRGNPDDLDSFKSKGVRKYNRSLTKEQKVRLQEATYETKDYALKTRYSIFLAVNDGLSVRETAIELGITPGVVQYWLENGNPDDLTSFDTKKNSERKGRKGDIKLTPKVKKRLLSLAQKNLPNKGTETRRWKNRELAEELEKRTGVRITRFHVHNLLRREGVCLDRTPGDVNQ